MAKRNKLNKQVEETTQEISTEVPKETISNVESQGLTYGEDYVENPEIERVLFEKPYVDFPEEIIDEPSPVIEFANEPIEIKIDITPKRTLDSLTSEEYRHYQRTGRMPE
jgi:hypothetical protein